MIIFYSCIIVLVFGIIDAFVFKGLKQWESKRLSDLQAQEEELVRRYKKMVQETQTLKSQAESAHQSVPKDQGQPAPDKESPKQPSQTNIAMQLLQRSLITRQQLQKAKQYQKSIGRGKPIEEILVLLGSLDQDTLDEFLAS
ncbi:hypothetical protein [Desulfoplanes sp.]